MKVLVWLLCSASRGEAVVSIGAEGEVTSIALRNANEYRVTISGFARVLHVGDDRALMKCLQASVRKRSKVKISSDLNGKILFCDHL